MRWTAGNFGLMTQAGPSEPYHALSPEQLVLGGRDLPGVTGLRVMEPCDHNRLTWRTDAGWLRQTIPASEPAKTEESR